MGSVKSDRRHRTLRHTSSIHISLPGCINAPRLIMSSKQSVIIVGGGGTIGSSTALHLLRQGYSPDKVTVLDPYPIPSAQSAGNDLNKIMGIRLRNKVDLQLSLEALDMWSHDELFRPFFHQTGRVSLCLILADMSSIALAAQKA